MSGQARPLGVPAARPSMTTPAVAAFAPTVRLTRVYRFEAAHRLVSARLSDAENTRVFGKCSRPGGHGHNYEIAVTLEGAADPRTGLLIGRAELDALVHEHLLMRVDHYNLNDVIDVVTTGENLARVFWSWIAPRLPDGARLVRLHVLETRNNRFETTGR
jgi:6-pyruvoyltetrahydropterin/6-carboxytetrahydropterin synthase